ncbi:hypothetical protein Tco_0859453 [Tanacetum coccineum]|uniref:Uncharacterized protein n=1 Tax=Tanacetum coccineum TaxID=301880 RepID=A0ABQ5BC14_9ASTR
MGGSSSQPRTDPHRSPINAFLNEELYTPEFLESLQENTGYWQEPNTYEVAGSEGSSKRHKSSGSSSFNTESGDASINLNTTVADEDEFRRRPTAKGVRLCVADSHAGNHPEDGFTPLETIRRLLVVIRRRSHSGFEGDAFEPDRRSSLLLIYDLFLHFEEMAFRDFIYTEDDDDLAFLPKEPSLGFGTGSPFASVNTELPKDVEKPKVLPVEITADSGESPKAGVFIVHPGGVAARIKERKCKTRGGSSRPPVKRKLASRSSSSRAVRAKPSASKEDAPILSISDDDEGLIDCFELKDANACHLKISAITSPAWKGHLDNQMDLELLDLHDRCYARQAMVDNAVNKRARGFLQVIEKMSGEADVIKARERSHKEECEELRVKCEAVMAEFDQNPTVLVLREKISSLTADVKEHEGNLDRMMLESQKWIGYQVTLSTLESKVDSLEAEKARLEAVEASLYREVEELKEDRRDVVSKFVPYAAMELVHSDELGRLVGTLVSSAITYGHYRAYEQVAAMKEPFNLSKAKGYRSSYKKEHTQAINDFATATFPWLDEFVADAAAPIEALLSKKPPTLQKPAPLRTQMPVPSS